MIYFDNGATTYPKPREVLRRMYHTMKYAGGNAGRGGHDLADGASEVIYRCRESVCNLFGIENSMEVCFTYNATMAMNFAIKGVLKPGDHVILSPLEHNCVMRPVYKLSQAGVEYTVMPSDQAGRVSQWENEIKENTKLIIVNHASNVMGTIAPIREIGKIAHRHGILFLVDTSQSAGHISVDVEADHIDMLACSGHKGLFGPQGTGILFIRSEIQTDTIMEGGTGSMSQMLEQPLILPDRFESGTLNAPGIAGLGAGIEFVLHQGIPKLRKHELILTETLLRGLSAIPGAVVYGPQNAEEMVGVVGFNLGNWDSVNLCSYLNDKYKVMLRGGLHCSYLAHKTAGTLDKGCARASLSYFNTRKEVEKFLNIIDMLS